MDKKILVFILFLGSFFCVEGTTSFNRHDVIDFKMINKAVIPPLDVQILYQKYAGRRFYEVILASSPQDAKDALVLLNYHLFKPDGIGACCIAATERSTSTTDIELIKKCLPDRKYLREHPEFIDGLYQLVLKKKCNQRPSGLLEFLADRNSVINCPERDAYFREDVEYELKSFGAKEGEYFEDMSIRLMLNSKEQQFFISKLLDVAKRMTLPNYNIYPPDRYFGQDYSHVTVLVNNGNYEDGFNAVDFKMFRPTQYGTFTKSLLNNYISAGTPAGTQEFGTCSRILGCSYEIVKNHGEAFLLDFLKKTFPSREYRTQNQEVLQKYLVSFVFLIRSQSSVLSSETALKIFEFLKQEGIDLKEISNKCDSYTVDYMKKLKVID